MYFKIGVWSQTDHDEPADAVDLTHTHTRFVSLRTKCGIGWEDKESNCSGTYLVRFMLFWIVRDNNHRTIAQDFLFWCLFLSLSLLRVDSRIISKMRTNMHQDQNHTYRHMPFVQTHNLHEFIFYFAMVFVLRIVFGVWMQCKTNFYET